MKLVGRLLANKYLLISKLGSGSSGEVYEGVIEKTGEPVAIKLESLSKKRSQLLSEANVYKIMQGEDGIPKFYDYFFEGGYNIMVIELLGPSLEKIRNDNGGTLSTLDCLIYGEQMLSKIESFHKKSLLHRDIKPDNFALGLGTRSRLVYILDFGLVKRFRNPLTGKHFPYRDGKNMAGTLRFASINTHLGIEQSRRDDLECLAYSLIFLIKGKLPWQGTIALDKKSKFNKVLKIKLDISIYKLCENLPHNFTSLLYYIRSLEYEEDPDYEKIRKHLSALHLQKIYNFSRLNIHEISTSKPEKVLNSIGAGKALPASKEEIKTNSNKNNLPLCSEVEFYKIEKAIPNEYIDHKNIEIPSFDFIHNEHHWSRIKNPQMESNFSTSSPELFKLNTQPFHFFKDFHQFIICF